MPSILPPPADTQPETCHEYLGELRGFCPRPAHAHDLEGFGFCWPHAGLRGLGA